MVSFFFFSCNSLSRAPCSDAELILKQIPVRHNMGGPLAWWIDPWKDPYL